MAKKRTPPLLHGVIFGGEHAVNETAPVFFLGGVPYCWSPERGKFPRPRGWGTRGKVYLGIDPDELMCRKVPA